MGLRFWLLCHDRSGVTGIEYTVLLAVISVLIIVSATTLGEDLSSHYFDKIANAL